MPRSYYCPRCQLVRISNGLKSAYDSHGLIYILRRGAEESLIRTPLLRRIYWKFAPSYFYWKYEFDNEFSAPLDVIKLIYVSPEDITNFSGRNFTTGTDRKSNIGKILYGDWDKHSNQKLTDEYIFRSIFNHFENKKPWKKTDLYTIESNRIKETGKGVWHGCNDKEDLEKRFEEVDNLFLDIRDNGYTCCFHRRNSEKLTFMNCLLNEVTVDIGRNGELLFVDGRHRLAIAKTLDLDRIPVFVLVRHQKWMETRDAIYEGEFKKQHPDICEF